MASSNTLDNFSCSTSASVAAFLFSLVMLLLSIAAWIFLVSIAIPNAFRTSFLSSSFSPFMAVKRSFVDSAIYYPSVVKGQRSPVRASNSRDALLRSPSALIV